MNQIKDLTAIHYDGIIHLLSQMPNSITNLSSIWTKLMPLETASDFDGFIAKYSQLLTALDITFVNTKSDTKKLIGDLKQFNKLRKLNLILIQIEQPDFQSEFNQLLTQSPMKQSLEQLNLCFWSGNSQEILKSIASTTQLKSLTLNFKSDFISKDLEDLKSLSQLKHLRVILKTNDKAIFNQINQFLPNLESLELVCSSIDSIGLNSIGKLKSLKYLDVVCHGITDEMFISFVDSLEAGQLNWLRVNSSRLTNKSVNRLIVYCNSNTSQFIEFSYSSTQIDLITISLPNNLICQQKPSQFLLNFPGSSPRGF